MRVWCFFVLVCATPLAACDCGGAPTEHPLFVSPTSVDFGAVAPGERRMETIALRNRASSQIEIEDVVVTGSSRNAFVIAMPDRKIAVGGSATMRVEYAPREVGSDRVYIAFRVKGSPTPLGITADGRCERADAASGTSDAGPHDAGFEDAGQDGGDADAGEPIFTCGLDGGIQLLDYLDQGEWGPQLAVGDGVALLLWTKETADAGEVFVANLDASGELSPGAPVTAIDGEDDRAADAVWNGTEFGIVFLHATNAPHSHQPRARFLRLQADGSPVPESAREPYGQRPERSAEVAWNPADSEWAVVVASEGPPAPGSLMLRRLDASGEVILESLSSLIGWGGEPDPSGRDGLVWAQDRYALLDGSRFVEISALGAVEHASFTDLSSFLVAGSVAWSGGGYGLSGVGMGVPSKAVFLRVEQGGGVTSGSEIELGVAATYWDSSITWAGNRWIAAWTAPGSGEDNDTDVWIASVNASGVLECSGVVGGSSEKERSPDVAWIDGRVVVAYEGVPPSSGNRGIVVVHVR